MCMVGQILYRNAPIRGLALSEGNICEISHKKLCDKQNMIVKVLKHKETVSLSLLNDCISASICLKGLKNLVLML